MLPLPPELQPLVAESVRGRLLAALCDFYAQIVLDSGLTAGLGHDYDIRADFAFDKKLGQVVASVTVVNADGFQVFCLSL